MNTKTITDQKKLVLSVLLCAVSSWVQAGNYSLVEITKENVNVTTKANVRDTTYTIYTGNQYLNNNGQVVGVSREYNQNKLFTNGDRAFMWQPSLLQRGRLTTLPTLTTDFAGYGESTPSGINNKSQIVGTSRFFDKDGIDRGQRAVSWTNGLINNLGKNLEKSGIQSSVGTGINASGQVVGSGLLYQNGEDKGPRPHLWSAGKAKNLGTFFTDSNGYSDIRVTGINNVGHVLGLVFSVEMPGWFRGYVWANNSFQKLVDLGVALDDSNYGIGDAFNNKDEVAGRSGVDSAMVLWKNGVIQKTGMLSTVQGVNPPFPLAINDKSQITGWEDFDTGGSHAFFWDNGQMTDLGALGVDESGYATSYPTALNNNGQVVGNSSYSEGGVAKGFHAFIYQNKTLTDLNTLLPIGSGWLLENALAINDKGQIAVYGTYSKGITSYKAYALLTPGK